MDLKEYVLLMCDYKKEKENLFVSDDSLSKKILNKAQSLFYLGKHDKELQSLYNELKKYVTPKAWVEHFLPIYEKKLFINPNEFFLFLEKNKDLINQESIDKIIIKHYGLSENKNLTKNYTYDNKIKNYKQNNDFLSLPKEKQELIDSFFEKNQELILKFISKNSLQFVNYLNDLNRKEEIFDFLEKNYDYFLENFEKNKYKINSYSYGNSSILDKETTNHIDYKLKNIFSKIIKQINSEQELENFAKLIKIDKDKLISNIELSSLIDYPNFYLKYLFENLEFPASFKYGTFNSKIEILDSLCGTNKIERGRGIRIVDKILYLLEKNFFNGEIIYNYFKDEIRREISQEKVYEKIKSKQNLDFLISYSKEKAKTTITLASRINKIEETIIHYEKEKINNLLNNKIDEKKIIKANKI